MKVIIKELNTTMDYDESDNKGIKHINALKWLLDFD